MELHIYDNSVELGRDAAECIAKKLNEAIAEKGKARMILSTGASQFDMFRYLVDQDVDWKNVEMFHLDEYIGLSESHPASFRKYLRDRFTNIVPVTPYFVNTEGDIRTNLEALTGELRKETIDVGVIGIGENGHIAFNDPPADFDTREAYKVVDLDEKCRNAAGRRGMVFIIGRYPCSGGFHDTISDYAMPVHCVGCSRWAEG